MENLRKIDLINMIDRNSQELHEKIDRQLSIMSAILEEGMSDNILKSLSFSHSSSREIQLKEALKETITVLEQTKKSFKSKRLESLRKNLTQILIDAK